MDPRGTPDKTGFEEDLTPSNSDRACPVAEVTFFDPHVTKFKLFTFLDRRNSTEIRFFINMMNCLIQIDLW